MGFGYFRRSANKAIRESRPWPWRLSPGHSRPSQGRAPVALENCGPKMVRNHEGFLGDLLGSGISMGFLWDFYEISWNNHGIWLNILNLNRSHGQHPYFQNFQSTNWCRCPWLWDADITAAQRDSDAVEPSVIRGFVVKSYPQHVRYAPRVLHYIHFHKVFQGFFRVPLGLIRCSFHAFSIFFYGFLGW